MVVCSLIYCVSLLELPATINLYFDVILHWLRTNNCFDSWLDQALACSFSGRERRVQSSILTLEVRGRPQVLVSDASRVQEYVQHSDAVIKAVFCSDPKYRKAFWDWGNLNMSEGNLKRERDNKTCLQPVSKLVEKDVEFFKRCWKGISLVRKVCQQTT